MRDRRRILMTVLMGEMDLAERVAMWQNTQTDLVHVGGMKAATMGGLTSVLTATNTGASSSMGIIQDGYINSIVASINANASVSTWKFKLFRWTGTGLDYTFVGEREFTPANEHTNQTFAITPILAQDGDLVGFYNPSGTLHIGNGRTTAKGARVVAGDITDAVTLPTPGANNLAIDCLGLPPYLAITGDSIPEGHNAADHWDGILHDLLLPALPGGDATSEIGSQLKALVPTLKYQNLALGSQTYAWVASTGIVECVDVKPHTIWIHCGVNDVATARLWAEVAADLDTIRAAVPSTIVLLISEILPWPASDDTQAGTIRTWNAALAVWCAANNATVVRCHDEMAQVRVSTGELDDGLAGMFYADNVHLSTAGVLAMARIVKRYL